MQIGAGALAETHAASTEGLGARPLLHATQSALSSEQFRQGQGDNLGCLVQIGKRQASVVYQSPVVVGEPLQGSYTYYEVPQYPDYNYIVLNNQRVIVDRKTHRVVRVMP